MYVDGEEYGSVQPPSRGFHTIVKGQSVSQQWNKGTILAPFDELVRHSENYY